MVERGAPELASTPDARWSAGSDSLISLLVRGDLGPRTADALAATGAHPDGAYAAAALSSGLPDGQVGSPRGCLAAGACGTALVVLAQVDSVDRLAELLAVRRVPAGFGLVRRGLAGAAATCTDALQAHALAASRGADVRFSDDWVAATVLGARARLVPLCARGEQVATSHSHLAEAVRAYAGHRMSVVAASRVLHLHPNTVKYRLERWHQLTGWDARSFRGLAQSMACLEAAS